jgi:hypothetical protein
MKKYNYLLLFLISGLVLCFVFLSSKDASKTEDIFDKQTENESVPQNTTTSMPIPDVVEFCGEEIFLNRFDMHERFDREINSFAYFHSTMMLTLKRANRFFPVIEPILKKNNIPDDFKYLCVIESNLDIRALSPAGAAGLWQFMPATGKSYELEITSEIDERYHVEKATEAACKYLKDAYAKYRNWVNVAASYNAGMGRISSALEEQSVDSAFDLLLVSETSRYVFRIIAAKLVFENPLKYGFYLKKDDLYPFIPVQSVTINQSIENLAEFAKQYDLNYMLLKEFNPWLRDKKLTVRVGKSYELAVPDKKDLFYTQ